MENKSHALLAGVFTVCLIVAALIIIWYMNMDKASRVPYMIATNQPIPGLNAQAAVRYRGLNVGRVISIEFNPEKRGEILILMNVKKDTPITTTTYATLSYQGVTGISSIELDDNEVGSPLLPTSEDEPTVIPMQPGLLTELQLKGLKILTDVEKVMTNIAYIFNEDNSKALVSAVNNVGKAADSWSKVPDQIEPTVKQLPQLTAQARELMESLTELSKKTNHYLAEGADGESASRLNKLSDETKRTLHNVNTLIEQYKQRPSGILFGARGPEPGPGEPGFNAAGAK